jgi:hypothetical protein
MALTWEIPSGARLVRIVMSGSVDLEEIVQARNAMHASPDHGPGMVSLVDLRGVTRFEVAGAEIRDLALHPESLGLLTEDTKVAIVAPTAEGFGLARMFELWREGRPGRIRVFREPEDAEAWIVVQAEPA